MDIKTNNPRLTRKQICKQLGLSDSTIKRHRGDIQMDSKYNRNNYKKNATEQKPTTTTKNPSKNENLKSITNNKTRNAVIKSGNPNIFHIDGRELIKQAFSF